jgi:hypothetical protein
MSDSTAMVLVEVIREPEPTVKPKPKAAWKEEEIQILPENRIGIVFLGLAALLALAALDQVRPIHKHHRLFVIVLSLILDDRWNIDANDYLAVGRW